MRPLTALRKGASVVLGGTGGFTQPSWWEANGPYGWSNLWSGDETVDTAEVISEAYKQNGPLFTTILVRLMVFSEVRFQWQRFERGRPGDLYGDRRLGILERPYPGGTTGELLARMEQDVSLTGNFFATEVGGRIRRMRSDCVTIVSGSESDSPFALDAEVVGYLYSPPREDPTLIPADRVCHWSPIPDPTAQWRGMSWISSIMREVEGDQAATRHKRKFFENGATSNMVIVHDKDTPRETVSAFKDLFDEAHRGADKAYKTIHLGGGADAKMIGADLKQLDFKVTQGAGESRIAAASMVGAVMAQFSEGMQGSSLNAGNFQAARRRFADVWARPQWRSAAAALESLVPPGPGERLWYDARDVSFLQEDEKDAAEIFRTEAQAAKSLTEAGFTPESVKAAVSSRNVSMLEHTGVFSVQLQPPGAGEKSLTVDVPASDVPDLLKDGWTIVKEPA